MFRIFILAIPCLLCACEYFTQGEADGPPPLKIERVISCNKYKTCVVVFQDGTQGLMTSPKAGEYGCKSMSQFSYIRCAPR